MDLNGSQLIPMDLKGSKLFKWIPIKPNRSQYLTIDLNRLQLIPMEPSESIWVLMNPNGSQRSQLITMEPNGYDLPNDANFTNLYSVNLLGLGKYLVLNQRSLVNKKNLVLLQNHSLCY